MTRILDSELKKDSETTSLARSAGTVSLMPRPLIQAEHLNCPLAMGYEHPPHRAPVEGERVLGTFILPPFQRPPVWTEAQQVSFIESLWLKLPVGAYTVNYKQGAPTDCWLLDGQQRWTAIIAYTQNAFRVFGHFYDELPMVDVRGFEFGMPMARLQTSTASVEKCQEIYNRLAYGGTPHERAGA